MHDTTSPPRPVWPRTLPLSLQRLADDGIRTGARILVVAGVGAIAAVPFVVTAAIGS